VSTAIRLAESLVERGFHISKEQINSGIGAANHPGRLELWEGPPRVLFDGAHNPAAARSLRAFLNEFIHSPVTLVFGAMRDKNLEGMAEILFPLADHLILTQPDNPRAASLDSLKPLALANIDSEKITLEPDARQAFRVAHKRSPVDGVICVTGSLYLIGEVQSRGLNKP
jgi:dihydrofolate synthase/folylpolyglutamate synthase